MKNPFKRLFKRRKRDHKPDTAPAPTPGQFAAPNQHLAPQNRFQAQAPVAPNGARMQPAPALAQAAAQTPQNEGPAVQNRGFQAPTPGASSPNFRATYSAIKHCLDAVSKLAIPGIGTAATGLRIVMESAQAQEQVKLNIEPVQKRIERLWFYIKRAKEVLGDKDDPELFTPLERQLDQLAADIKASIAQNRIAGFFNGTDDLVNFAGHQRDIDSHIQDLMFFIMTSTKQKSASLDQDCEKAVTALRAESPPEEAHGILNYMRNNEFKEINDGYLIDNTIQRQGTLVNDMQGNKFGNIYGGFLKGNKI
ncbi:hypothetical protein C8J56DRAFT_958333, partial [Mycena floridula]